MGVQVLSSVPILSKENRMKKKVEAIRTDHIIVNCERNDSTDVKCGSAPTLGYDFYVDPDETKALEKVIKKTVSDCGQPLMSISINEGAMLLEEDEVWNEKDIIACIENGYGC